MAHVVAEPCFICESVDCVTVCPTDCFRQDEQMLYIHPDECIDCEACVPACPVEAIYHEDALRPEWRPYRDLNATLARQTSRVKIEATSRRARQATTTSFSA